MMELLAGLLVAIAALAYVLEPLRGRHQRMAGGSQAIAPELLVQEMSKHLAITCAACGTSAEPGQAFCSRCGRVLFSSL